MIIFLKKKYRVFATININLLINLEIGDGDVEE